MIVVDTSALMAIVLREPEAIPLRERLIQSDGALMSAGTVVEAASVYLASFTGQSSADQLLKDLSVLGIRISPMTAEQAVLAAQARFRFGKGRGGPLNLGDCFSYALAKSMNLPLLFKGGDFRLTDVSVAAY